MKALYQTKQGQCLFIGCITMMIGFISEAFNGGLAIPFFLLASILFGYNIAKDILLDWLHEKKVNVDLLMLLSALGSISIGYFSEAAMLLFIFSGAEVLESYVSDQSTKEIEALMTHLPEKATVIGSDQALIEKNVASIQIGERLMVKKGEQITLDGIVEQDTVVNESALTGESVPVFKTTGDTVFAGTVNQGDTIIVQVSKTKQDTVFSNIVHLVKEAQENKSQTAKRIDSLKATYVKIVLILVPLFIMFLLTVQGLDFQTAFYKGMILMTVSSPCALVVSVVPASLSAVSSSAKQGVLIKDGDTLEKFSQLTLLCSDKTGTLTYGQFSMVDYHLDDDLLPFVLAMEQHSTHPLAASILAHFPKTPFAHLDHIKEVAGLGMEASNLRIGSLSFFKEFSDPFGYKTLSETAYSLVYVGKDNTIVGYFALEDNVREEVKTTVHLFKKYGVTVKMLTGDNEKVAQKVANEVGIDSWQANCLPEDKQHIIKQAQKANEIVGMIGDGINDAPALALADISIAMGTGTAIAMETSDVLMMQNKLQKLLFVFQLSKRLNRIIVQNMLFSVGVITLLVVCNLFGVLDLTKGVIFHEASTILVILNSLRLLSGKVDVKKE